MESSSPTQPAQVKKYRFKFNGNFLELVKLIIKNTFLTVFTFGLYIPYARTNMRKYLWRSCSFGGKPFLFHADPKNLLKGYVILFFVMFGVATISKIGESQAGGFLPLKFLFLVLPQITVIFFLAKYQYRAYAYLVNNTSFRSVRFNVNPEGSRPYIMNSLQGWFLTVLTLGIYYPFMAHEHSKIKWKNTAFGTHGFSYKGHNKDYAFAWYKGMLLTIFTLGLYGPWFAVSMHRYSIDNLRFQGAKFSTTVTGVDCMMLSVKSFFLVVLTFGLAIPYILNMNLAFYINKLTMKGDINFEEILQTNRTHQDESFSDGVSDLFDGDAA